MPVLSRSSSSVEDYERIWHWIAKKNPEAADVLLLEFDQKLELLARNPELGPERMTSFLAFDFCL